MYWIIPLNILAIELNNIAFKNGLYSLSKQKVYVSRSKIYLLGHPPKTVYWSGVLAGVKYVISIAWASFWGIANIQYIWYSPGFY